jgi:Dolichyl-phosphate-mannose-protein mannosyltransferase
VGFSKIARVVRRSFGTVSPQRTKPELHRYLPLLAVLVLVSVSAVRDARIVFRYSSAVGANGYYYVLQVDHIRAHGRDYFSKVTPAALYLLAGIAYLTSDSVIGVKLGSILFTSLLNIGIFFLVSEYLRSAWYGFAGAALATISGLHFYFLAEFISNLGGCMLLVWSLWCALKFARLKKPGWAVASLVLFALAVFSHRLILPVATPLLVCYVVHKWLFANDTSRQKRVVAIVVLAVIWVLPALLAAQHIVPLPDSWLREISIPPRIPLDRNTFPEVIVLSMVSISILILLVWRRPHRSFDLAERILATASVFSLGIILNPFLVPALGSTGLGQRLRLISYIFVAVLAPGLVRLLQRVNLGGAIPYAAALVAAMMIASAALPLPAGLRNSFLEQRERLIGSLKRVSPELGPSVMVVAPHGDQFVVTATTGFPSQNEVPSQSNFRTVYWLLTDVTDPGLASRSLLLFKTSSGATVLTDDATLRSSLPLMLPESRATLSERNPTLESIQLLARP